MHAALADGRLAAHFGEVVPLREHLLQTAQLLLEETGDVELAAAGLLHDLGWAHGATEATHAQVSARLAAAFGCSQRVERAIELHVVAKRYLVVADPSYDASLSPESRATLAAQGGPLAKEERAAVLGWSGFRDALAVRRADDRAKDPTRRAIPLATLVGELAGVFRSGAD